MQTSHTAPETTSFTLPFALPQGVTPQDVAAAAAAIRRGEADGVLLRGGQPAEYLHGRGVRPLLQLLEERPQALADGCWVDKIVGKAAAMLAVLGRAGGVYALTASRLGLQFLAEHGLPAAAEQEVPQIVNRRGDGLCPLEQSVQALQDPAEAPARLRETIAVLMAQK